MSGKSKTRLLSGAIIILAVGGAIAANTMQTDALTKLQNDPKARLTHQERKTLPDQPPAEWFACTRAQDCITVGWVPCKWTAVSTKHQEIFERYNVYRHNLDMIEYDCPQTFKDTPKPKAACVSQHCVVPPAKADIPDEWYSCAEGESCTAIQLNCEWKSVNTIQTKRFLTKKYQIEGGTEHDETCTKSSQPTTKCINQRCVIPEVTH